MPAANILVVEDDDSIRTLLIEYLKECGHVAVDGARDGVDALHHVSTRRYEVVILDVMMPYMTGIDFLDSLEAMMSDPSIKGVKEAPAVLVITAAPQEQIPNSAIEERFPSIVRGIFRKPLQIEEFAQAVLSLLPQRRVDGASDGLAR